MDSLRTCLWFDDCAEAAAEFYVSLIPGSAIEARIGGGPGRKPFMMLFHLAGVPYQAMNGGPSHVLSPAVSISVSTEDQVETDALWAAVIADGGEEGRCGWCVDRFGLSWQIVPRALPATVGGADPEGAARATKAMMAMNKIDIAALEAAYRG
ncbi:MAG: VOC family protein [Maritimibacter sp.]